MGIPIRRFTTARLAGLVTLGAGLAACGAMYYLFVASQTEYYNQRNFRILTTIGMQLDAAANAEATVFRNLAKDPNGEVTLKVLWKAPRYQGEPPKWRPMATPTATATLVTQNGEPKLNIAISDGTRTDSFRLPTANLSATVIHGKVGKETFDTLLLVNSRGEIVFGEGSRLGSLGPTGLGAVPIHAADGHDVTFASIASATGVHRATISGTASLLFLAPCCRSIVSDSGGLLVAGLVDEATFNSESRAISTTLVKIGAITLLMAVVAWPFLRLTLIGERQRLRRSDFFQLGLSSVAGLGIVTILILDSAAYWRLSRDRDAQLSALADGIESHASQEVQAGYEQLRCLEKKVAEARVEKGEAPILLSNALASPQWVCDAHGATTWRYPFFESVSLIDGAGMQQRKLSTLTFVPSLIPVGERLYFRAANKDQLWPASSVCPERCIVQSVWSWTTGTPQVVVAKRRSPEIDEKESAVDYKVASIALPMLSLIRPVLPAGFEFAVIADDGQVLFHSDYQRNLTENFFQETDDSRRLRAEMHAHSTEPLNLRYWGAAYRAFVKPMKGTPWSIVTLYRKGEGWALNREWIVVSFIFLSLHLLVWVATAGATLFGDASWVWPDPSRRSAYGTVAACHVLLLALTAGLGLWLQRAALLKLGLLLPFGGWLLTAMLLKPRRPASAPGAAPLLPYSLAACLTLAVCGVAPGVLLFLASYQIHAQSYVKNNELDLARRIHERQASLREDYPTLVAADSAPEERGRYHEFLYGMTVEQSAVPPAASEAPDHQHHADLILGALEEYLPYYSEASVKWRELFHDHAGDDSWTSSRERRRLVLETSLDTTRYRLSSGVPSVMHGDEALADTHEAAPVQAAAAAGPLGGLVLFGVALGFMTVGIVSRLKRHVLLTGVVQPRWARARLALNAGDNMFVRCDDRTTEQHIEGADVLHLGPIASADNPEQRWRQTLSDMDRNQDPCVAVLVDDLDDSLDDPAIMKRKLAYMEDLVEDSSRSVVVLSRHSAHGMAEAMRRAGDSGTGDRWKALIQSFVLIDWREKAGGEPLAAIAVEAAPGEALTPGQKLLNDEMRSGDPFVAKVCRAIGRTTTADQPLKAEEAFDELVDRTAHYYRQIWNSCSDEDKVVLTHVAEDGLVNWSLRRGVRRLLAKRLLFKDPELRLMNESFRRFVLSHSCLKEVRQLEDSEQPSPWDRLRVPFAFAMVAAGVFLFATQKELYNAILGTTTAAAASVPALIKAVGTLAGSRGGDAKPGA